MKWAKCCVVVGGAVALTYGNFIAFSKYFATNRISFLLLLAIGSTCIQSLLLITVGRVFRLSSVNTGNRGRIRQYIPERFCALLLDSAIAFAVSLVVIAVLSARFDRALGMALSAGSAYLILLLRDSFTRNGSVGKKICRLYFTDKQGALANCSIVNSAVRNFGPATFVMMTIVLSGESFQSNAWIDTLYLVLAVSVGLDLLFSKKMGGRIIDTLTRLTVTKSPPNPSKAEEEKGKGNAEGEK